MHQKDDNTTGSHLFLYPNHDNCVYQDMCKGAFIYNNGQYRWQNCKYMSVCAFWLLLVWCVIDWLFIICDVHLCGYCLITDVWINLHYLHTIFTALFTNVMHISTWLLLWWLYDDAAWCMLSHLQKFSNVFW